MSDGHFENVIAFPDPEAEERYKNLVGLDTVKERLEKEAEIMVKPELLESWSKEHHESKLQGLELLLRRPPLFVFAGDVGTGKTELAMTFGDRLARTTKISVELFMLSLRTRGSGAVGEMTRLISEAFRHLHSSFKTSGNGKKIGKAAILLIDEADSLAQSRELAQMHHEDRAGVNALIRGIDDIANSKLPCLIIMCSNRLTALDPAVQRRAAAIFEFERPNDELRQRLLKKHLDGTGLSSAEISAVSKVLGDSDTREYGATFSDITQRYIPSLILQAYPKHKITGVLALKVAHEIKPTPPFKTEF